VPLTLLILLITIGALVAAGIPLVLGLTAVMGTFGIIAIASQVQPMDQSVSALVLLVGFAVGVDYSMFHLKREREKRAAGRSEQAALEARPPRLAARCWCRGCPSWWPWRACFGPRRHLRLVRVRDDDGVTTRAWTQTIRPLSRIGAAPKMSWRHAHGGGNGCRAGAGWH